MHNEQITALINEIETIEKNIASLSQQVADINSSISQKDGSIQSNKDRLTELENRLETHRETNKIKQKYILWGTALGASIGFLFSILAPIIANAPVFMGIVFIAIIVLCIFYTDLFYNGFLNFIVGLIAGFVIDIIIAAFAILIYENYISIIVFVGVTAIVGGIVGTLIVRKKYYFLKRKERKILDEEILELNRKIEEQNTEIKELKGKVDVLTRQEKEAQNKAQQIRQEKNKLQQEEDERLRKEAEEAAKVEKLRLAEEKRKKEEALINSASQGDAKAQYDLSIWYLNEKNIEQYIHWLKQSAERGYPTAQRQLGLAYLEGKNPITKDINKAVEWLEKAAEQGDSESQFRLGCLYRYGDTDFEADINKGLYWLEKAANNNNADAQYELAILYGDDSQFEKMVLWLEKAINQGHKQAAFHLARLHADKIIPNADFNIAFRLLNQVVNDSQNPSASLAMIYLGALYCAGKGTERNPEQGANYIEKGMSLYKEKLDPKFSFRLGMLHYDGRVYGKTYIELKQALVFFKIASAGGITDAAEYIVKTLKHLKELIEGNITIIEKTIKDSWNHMNNYETFWSENTIADHKKRCRDDIERDKKYLEIRKQELDVVIKELQAIEDKAYDW